MTAFMPLSPERHGTKRWVRFRSYSFAARTSVIHLVADDVPRAVVSHPIAFMRDGEDLALVGVMSLEAGRNLFVAPDGRWITGYVPAGLRGHPFRLVSAGEGRHALCVDEASGLIVDSSEGEPLFGADGQLSPAVQEVARFLTQVEQSRMATRRVCGLLQRHGVVRPWAIKARTSDGERDIKGLWQVDEAALNALPPPAFEELRRAGALPLCYFQLLSAQHLPTLGQLAAAHARAHAARNAPITGVFDSPTDGDIDIDWNAFGSDAPAPTYRE